MYESRRGTGFYVSGGKESERKVKRVVEDVVEEETLSILAPFHPVPKVDFGDVRLGSSRVRVLRVRNPSAKPLSVSIEGFSESECAFVVDHRGPFSLGPRLEARLRLAWAPREKGSVRETATIKYGNFKTLLQVNGSCVETAKSKKHRLFQLPTLHPVFPFPTGSCPPTVSFGEPFPPVSREEKEVVQVVEVVEEDKSFSVFKQIPEPFPPQEPSNPISLRRETFTTHLFQPLMMSNEIPLGSSNARRETYTLEEATPAKHSNLKEATFAIPAAPEMHQILSEMKHVRSRLEDYASGPMREEGLTPLQQTRELLNDIQTELICSPSRHSSSLLTRGGGRLEDFDFDLESEDKENNPPRARAALFPQAVPQDVREERFRVETEVVYKELIYTEEQEVIEEVDISYELQEDGVTEFIEEETRKTCKRVETRRVEAVELSNLSMEEEEYVDVFMSPSEKKYSEQELADVSLLVAQHLLEEEEKEQSSGSQVVFPELEHKICETLPKINLHGLMDEHSVYETNLHECKESFLQASISEHNFLPIPEKRFCSTAVKDKPAFGSPSLESVSICKELFRDEQPQRNSTISIETSFENNTVVCKRDTFSISEDNGVGDEAQVSSETFTKSPAENRLQTINEVSEDVTSINLMTTRNNNITTSGRHSPNKSSEAHPKKPQGGLIFLSLNDEDSTIQRRDKLTKEPVNNSTTNKSSVSENTTTRRRLSKLSSVRSLPSETMSPSKKDSFLERRRSSITSLKPHHKTSLKLIKMASNPKLNKAPTALIRHPNLYSANNIYYDERWIDKQEKGFTKCLNFILTPWTEGSSEKKMDAAKLWSACSEASKVSRAPTREVMSYRAYTAGKEMNNLRISAVRLWQSQKMVEVIRRLEIEIEKKRLYVRDDRCLNKDLGMKQSFLSLLLNYNPLWLRIGLETIFGEVLHVTGNSDIFGISRFIITRLLCNPAISEEFIHPTVPHLHRPGYQEALKKFTLKKFLQLIYFLDQAKNIKLIRHNPCLFCKDADFKMSRDLLLDFSKKFLSGEGDVTKHLRYFGYDVSHKQTALDEFDFAVENIAIDLRCGVRICRVLDMILDQEITARTRVPAISRLQKIHNMDIAFNVLKTSPAGLPEDISSKDIVNGHMEKTLNFLWHIIFGLRLRNLLSNDKWSKEISLLRKSLKVRSLVYTSAASGLRFVQEKDSEGINLETDETVKHILLWSRLVCAHYGLEIENLSVSFSDGRALCFLLHHYYPSILPKEQIMMNTTVSALDSIKEERAVTMEEARKMNDCLLSNEKKNFKLFIEKVNELGGVPILIRSLDMSNTIPDRKITITFLAYFATRLLSLSNEINAARIIQLTWRRKKALREQKLLEIRNKAAIVIQKRIRLYLRSLRMKKYESHVLTIQRYYRGYLSRVRVQNIRKQISQDAALKIQSWWRTLLAKRAHRSTIRKVCFIQASFRRYIERKQFLRLRERVIFVQRKWRGLQETRRIRMEYLQRLEALVKMQSVCRGFIIRKRLMEMKRASLVLQSRWRGILAIREAQRRRHSVLVLQAHWRGSQQRRNYRKYLNAVTLVQRRFRSYMSLKEARSKYAKRVAMAVRIQAFIRGRRERICYLKWKQSAVKLQSYYKGNKCRSQFLATRNAALVIQRWFKQSREIKKKRFMQEKSAIVIQSYFKFILERKRFSTLKASTLTIQRRWRKILDERAIEAQKRRDQAARIILRNLRMHIARKNIRAQVFKIIKAQSCVRRYLANKELKRRIHAVNEMHGAIVIQSAFRGYIQKSLYLKLKTTVCFLQVRWRYLRAAREKRQRLLRIVKVQSMVRRFLAKKEYCLQKSIQEERSSVLIQTAFRGYTQRSKYIKLKHAVRFIQDRFRYLQRVAAKKEKYIGHIIRIQSLIRRYFAKKELHRRMTLVNHHYNATIIQSTFRSYATRQQYLKLKQTVFFIQQRWRYLREVRIQRQQYVRKIVLSQSCVRRYLAKMDLERRRHLAAQHHGATVIQSAFRGYTQRRNFLHLKEIVSCIQKRWRHLKEVKSRKLYIQRIVLIQTSMRRYLAKKELERRRHLVLQHRSATIIQSAFLCQNQKTKFTKLRAMTCFVQTRWRYLREARKRQRRIISSIVKVQSLARRYLALRKYAVRRNDYLVKQEAASLVIQRAFRSYSQRKKFLRLKQTVCFVQRRWRYLREIRCIIRLQCCIRGYLSRKRFIRRQKEEQASITLQSALRGYIQRQRYLKTKQRRLQHVVKVQSLARRYLAKRKLHQLKEKAVINQQTHGAVVLQSMLRGYTVRRRYTKLKQAASLIQARWRYIQALNQKKKEDQYILNIIKVQSVIRRYLATKELARRWTIRQKQRIDAAVVIQAAFKGYTQRLRYKRIKHVVRFVQERWRFLQHMSRTAYLQKTVRVQSVIRGYLVRREYIRRRVFARQTKAAVVIQAAFRGYSIRRRFLRMKIAACFLQRRWRAIRTELRPSPNNITKTLYSYDKDSAATLIQANVRTWIARKRFKKAINAVIILQSLWRGYRTRKHLIKDSRLSDVRVRLAYANKEATENKKLGSRVTYVLSQIYDIRSLGVLIKIVCDLDASTRYSEVCCDQMLEDGDRKPVVVLLDLIGRCNKSVPHIEVISGVLNTLINLARYERTSLYMAGLPETYKTCLDTLHRFEKNHSIICAKVFTFLYVLTFEDKALNEIKKFSKRLKEYLREYERRKMLLQRGPRPKASKDKKIVISHSPEWMCTKGFVKHVEDPILALKAVLDRLK